MKNFSKTFLIILLLLSAAGGGPLYAQKEGQQLIDSLLEEVPDMPKNNNAKASLYINIGMAYNYERDYAHAKEYFTKASKIYEQLGSRNGMEHMALMSEQMDLNISEIADRNDKERYFKIIGIIVGIGVIVMIVFFVIMVRVNKKRNAIFMQLREEQKKSEALLHNVLPAQIAGELKSKGMTFAQQFDEVTVVITDFVSFTTVAEKFSATQLVGELHACFKAFDEILEKHHIEKIKTVGDAYLAVAGLPVKSKNHAADAVAFALHMRDFMLRRREQLGEATFQMRIGVHSGSVIAGIVGIKKFAYDIWGDTVNTAARMEQNGEPGRVNISQSTYELVKDKFDCEYRGEIPAKKKGMMKMYFVNHSAMR